jgi:Uncharacterized conserved protein
MTEALRPPFVQPGKEPGQWLLLVRVQPGAKKTEAAGLLDARLKIRLAAPAVDNKANMALVAFVAKMLALRQSKVSLASGAISRQKNLLVESETEPDWQHLWPGQPPERLA